jgi:ribonuclease Z
MRQTTMKIILLGTGGPKPDPNRQGPALAARVDDISFLFDAGRGVTTQLVRARIPVTDIDHIFITHHHFDHIGNLGDMILSSWNLGRKTPIFIYGPEGTQRIISNLLNKVYHRDIAFRQKEARISGAALADIHKFVNTIDVNPGLVFADKGIEVHCQFVQHGHGLGIPQADWKCLAYRIEANHQSVTISGDAVDCQGLATLANETDLLVICCYLSKKEMSDKEGKLTGQQILACAPQVGKIAARVKAKKLLLTHIREKDEELINDMVAEIGEDYDGDIIVGKDLVELGI